MAQTARRTDLDTYDLAFRNHYQATYGNSRMPFDWYEPAYRYGHEVAHDERFSEREWEAVKSDLQAEWEERGEESAWEDVEEAVRHAWETVRDTLESEEAGE